MMDKVVSGNVVIPSLTVAKIRTYANGYIYIYYRSNNFFRYLIFHPILRIRFFPVCEHEWTLCFRSKGPKGFNKFLSLTSNPLDQVGLRENDRERCYYQMRDERQRVKQNARAFESGVERKLKKEARFSTLLHN